MDEGYKSRLKKTSEMISPTIPFIYSNKPLNKQKVGGDRFIPNRFVMNMKMSQYLVSIKNANLNLSKIKADFISNFQLSPNSPPFHSSNHGTYGWIEKRMDRRAYKERLDNIFTYGYNETSLSEARVLRFDSHKTLNDVNVILNKKSIFDKNRYIPSFPEKVLDMPRISNSSNATLMDWNKNEHDMVVALAESIFTWNPIERQCYRIPQQEENLIVSAVVFNNTANLIAIATNRGHIKIWNRTKFSYSIPWSCSHLSTVTTFAWFKTELNNEFLFSGCDCGCLLKNEILECGKNIDEKTIFLRKHFSISRLKINNNNQLVAVSSATSSIILIINCFNLQIVKTIEAGHFGIMGLIWCSYNIIATGSSGNERSIKIWNINCNSLIGYGVTKSRINCLEWGEKFNEIFSAHGQPHNCVYVWAYPSMEIKFRMCGHLAKVLHISVGLENKYLASLGVDETLLMWRIFDRFPDKKDVTKQTYVLPKKILFSSKFNIR